MLVTSNQANKQLRNYQLEYERLIQLENQVCRFTVSSAENLEEARPEYDFNKSQKQQEELLEKIRVLKHKINIFNTTTVLEEFNITIDEALVLLPQLTALVNKYKNYSTRLAKERVNSGFYNKTSSTVIEYTYSNYDIKDAEKAYRTSYEKLGNLQAALDKANNTITFEI